MNIVQQILVAILKSMCIAPFETALTKEEIEFMKYLKMLPYYYSVKLQTTLDGKSVLTWDSQIGRTVGCPITEIGFFFSQVEIYNERERSMRCDVAYNFPGDAAKADLLAKEISQMQLLLIAVSVDAKVYFK